MNNNIAAYFAQYTDKFEFINTFINVVTMVWNKFDTFCYVSVTHKIKVRLFIVMRDKIKCDIIKLQWCGNGVE